MKLRIVIATIVCSLGVSISALAGFPFSFWFLGSISVGANWGSQTCASLHSTCNATSSTQVVTVPSGSGIIKLGITPGTTWAYSKNGGIFVTFTNGTTVSAATGNQFAFRWTGGCEEGDTVSVKDNSNAHLVGTFAGSNIATCDTGGGG